MKKKLKLRRVLFSGMMATALMLGNLGSTKANPVSYTNPPDPVTYQYSDSDPLYAATHFHFFGKEYVEIRAHCHGNVATELFSAGSNSGSDKLGAQVKSEIFYFRKADAASGFIANFAGATVVLGQETNAQIMNGTEIGMYLNDGTTYKKIEPNSTVYTESTTARYIDFDTEFSKLTELSKHLVTLNPTSVNAASDTGITIPSTNVNYTIDLSGQTATTAYINIDGGSLTGGGDFTIKNIDGFKDGEAIVINYKIPSGTTSYTIPFTKIIITDASGQLNSIENWGDYSGHGNIVWNFYTTDTSGDVVPYTGELNTCDLFKGTILAPQATIKLANSNQDGNFIGNKIHGGGGETHRWDFGGYLPRPTSSTTPVPSTGAIEVIVTEKGTGTPVSNVPVTVTNTTATTETYTKQTASDGKTPLFSGLSVPSGWSINITPPTGYTVVGTTPITKSLSDPTTVQVHIEVESTASTPTTTPTGSLRVYVVDAQTMSPVENVDITLYSPDMLTTTPLTTDSTGYTGVATGLTIRTNNSDVYSISVNSVPSGYTIPAGKTQAITNTNLQTVTLYLSREATGSIQATLKDDLYDCSISGANIQILDENNNVISTLTTNSEGETTTVSNLPLNKTYTVKVTSIPDGNTPAPGSGTHAHPLPAEKTITLTTAAPDIVVPFVTTPAPNGALEVLVTDRFSDEPIKGAVVEVYNKDGILIDTCTTNVSGYTDIIQNLIIHDTSIPNNQKGIYTIKVTSVPTGYTAPLDSTVTITQEYTGAANTLTRHTLKIHQSGALQATIVDETTGAKIPNATGTLSVTKVNANGTTTTSDISFTTDSDGKTQIVDALLIGSNVTIKVDTVPTGYKKPANTTVSITGTGLKEEILKVSQRTGMLQATIVDETTGEPIPHANIVVKKSNGSQVYSGTTDQNGLTAIIPDLSLNETYTITTVSVPEGYTPPADKSVTITKEAPDVTSVTLVVSQVSENTGSLKAVITDKNTGNPISNATVEIKDSNGSVISTVKTDENGYTPVISNLTIGTTYTIHVSSVPNGYTAPDDKKQLISDSSLITVKLIVTKTTDTTVYTGDTTNIIGLFVLSVISLTGITILGLRKKEH